MKLPIAPEVLRFYQSVVGCPNSVTKCPNTVNDKKRGIPPRGFFTRGQPGEIVILIVGKNPGHLIEDEASLYLRRSHAGIVRVHLSWGERCFFQPHLFPPRARRSLTFHKNILRYFSLFLDVPEAKVFKLCALTDLVKCQTIGEQDALRKETKAECFDSHFMREVKTFRPRVIVALGNEAHRYLTRRASREQHGLPVIKLRHPSYYYKKNEEPVILRKLKGEIQAALRTTRSP